MKDFITDLIGAVSLFGIFYILIIIGHGLGY